MDFIPNTQNQKQEMLKEIGVNSVNDLFKDIPGKVKLKNELKLPKKLSEIELKRHVESFAGKNKLMLCFRGGGAYKHFIPAVVSHLAYRPEFYTAYTPYQPEVSQGTLKAIFEYQSLICNLTEMDVSNASMYDCASSLAEAAIMAVNIKGKKEIVMSKAVHPEYREVVKTYMKAHDVKVIEVDFSNGIAGIEELNEKITESTAGVIIQNPNFFGSIENLERIEKAVHGKNSLLIIAISDPTSLGLLKPPGSCNADIVVGEGQGFGNPVSFGGPYLGIMATKNEHVRKLPGRIVGKSADKDGNEGYILTLQAREQHIRREKATSNICTNEGLCALSAALYLVSLGKNLKKLAYLNNQKAFYAFNQIKKLDGYEAVFDAPFYNEFVIKCRDAEKVNNGLLKKGILGGINLGKHYPELKNCLLFCVTEENTKQDINKLVNALGEIKC